MSMKTERTTPGIEVRRSDVHGHGVFARVALPARARIGFYEGRRYTEAQASDRDWDNALTYVFGLSDGSLIDGSEGGNATRHLNHACEPNCEAIEYVTAKGTLRLRIETLRAIAAGEELSLDYALQVEADDRDDHPCFCASPRCRGSMVAPTQRASRAGGPGAADRAGTAVAPPVA